MESVERFQGPLGCSIVAAARAGVSQSAKHARVPAPRDLHRHLERGHCLRHATLLFAGKPENEVRPH
jgi:hypothetical protein